MRSYKMQLLNYINKLVGLHGMALNGAIKLDCRFQIYSDNFIILFCCHYHIYFA